MITRWGTWIETVIYYEENFGKVKTVIDKFDPKAAKSIRKSQKLLQNQNIKPDVSLIAQNFKTLVETIEKLQCPNLSLTESLSLVNDLKIELEGKKLVS